MTNTEEAVKELNMQWREHSIILNEVMWSLALALGIISEDDEQAMLDPHEIVEQAIAIIKASK